MRSNSTRVKPERRMAEAKSSAPGNLRIDSGKYAYASREPESRPPTRGSTRAEKNPYNPAKAAIGGLREFENRRHAARLQHAQHFLDPLLVIGQIAEAERDRDQIERAVAQRQRQRVGFE